MTEVRNPEDNEEVIEQEQPVVEEPDQEEPDAPEQVDEDEPAEGEESEEPEPARQPSRRESLRIQKLVSKLRERGQEPAAEDKKPAKTGLDYRTALDADDETIDQLEQDRASYGRGQYDEGLKRAEAIQFRTLLEIDSPRVATKYPELDKDSDKFHPAVAGSINDFYLGMVGYDGKTGMVQNGSVRYADFVESIMELADEIGVQKTTTSTKNIARQAATTGIRPDGSSAKRLNLNKDPSQMTDEELDAALSAGGFSQR
jgi:hypothetical protein